MNHMNSANRYPPLSVALHWMTLVLMIAIYASIEIHEILPRGTTMRRLTEDWHIYLGLCLLPIAIYRGTVVLRLQIPAITPQPPNWQMTITKLMKIYLYVLMIGMPLLGWIFMNAEGHAVTLFGIPLPSLAPESEGLAEFAEEAHEVLGISGYLFIAVHALAALYHHYLVKDNTLKRILPRFLAKD